MALQTSVKHLLFGNARESNDILAVASFNMLTSRSVTAFTAGAFRRFLLRDNAFVMGILVESVCDVGVAALARHTADIFIVNFIVTGRSDQGRRCRLLRTSDSYRKK